MNSTPGGMRRVRRTFALASPLRVVTNASSCPRTPYSSAVCGLTCTNSSGSLPTDILYFKDYVECGRTLGRGSLFIYTLPSSPLGEAAIHFGLQGPLLYAANGRASLGTALETAAEMVLLGEAEAMLAGTADEQEALYFVLAKDMRDRNRALCDSREARLIADKVLSVADTIQEFRALKGKKVRS